VIKPEVRRLTPMEKRALLIGGGGALLVIPVIITLIGLIVGAPTPTDVAAPMPTAIATVTVTATALPTPAPTVTKTVTVTPKPVTVSPMAVEPRSKWMALLRGPRSLIEPENRQFVTYAHEQKLTGGHVVNVQILQIGGTRGDQYAYVIAAQACNTILVVGLYEEDVIVRDAPGNILAFTQDGRCLLLPPATPPR